MEINTHFQILNTSYSKLVTILKNKVMSQLNNQIFIATSYVRCIKRNDKENCPVKCKYG